jgi:hypothetical protein
MPFLVVRRIRDKNSNVFPGSIEQGFTMKGMKDMKKGFDDLSYAIIGAAIEVQRHRVRLF